VAVVEGKHSEDVLVDELRIQLDRRLQNIGDMRKDADSVRMEQVQVQVRALAQHSTLDSDGPGVVEVVSDRERKLLAEDKRRRQRCRGLLEHKDLGQDKPLVGEAVVVDHKQSAVHNYQSEDRALVEHTPLPHRGPAERKDPDRDMTLGQRGQREEVQTDSWHVEAGQPHTRCPVNALSARHRNEADEVGVVHHLPHSCQNSHAEPQADATTTLDESEHRRTRFHFYDQGGLDPQDSTMKRTHWKDQGR
jgi:hypothetical protein